MPDQRIKKKKLRASEFLALLKIDGFTGKFKEPGAPGTPPVQVNVSPASASRQAVPSAQQTKLADPGQFVRPEDSFRIKDSLKKIVQAEPAVKAQDAAVMREQISSRESFALQQVVEGLESYAAKHAPEPIISIALKSHKPDVKGESIVILADNQLQVDKLESIKLQMQNFLMRFLNNGFIDLKFQIFDAKDHKEEKKLFTAGEKFEHFIKLNPVIADLKVIFGLELE